VVDRPSVMLNERQVRAAPRRRWAAESGSKPSPLCTIAACSS